ncbi:alpha-N-arabinofuranosidase 2 [Diaporthe helianthi]|uniref:Alpha-N-arabinofuranosidase 2 n=1 Tax=Diaporthe helianthi TaxID=158607 RepID=A0A2P5HPS1_DIAHE|nr:alpha-N-arabinofuranosidase 2 [Diaporthe helianthi]
MALGCAPYDFAAEWCMAHGALPQTNTTYSNPILTANVGDPYKWYLFTYSTNDNITLRRSKALTDNWDHQETRVVFSPGPRGQDAGQLWSTDLWVAQLLHIWKVTLLAPSTA